jgi:hypothetical protein
VRVCCLRVHPSDLTEPVLLLISHRGGTSSPPTAPAPSQPSLPEFPDPCISPGGSGRDPKTGWRGVVARPAPRRPFHSEGHDDPHDGRYVVVRGDRGLQRTGRPNQASENEAAMSQIERLNRQMAQPRQPRPPGHGELGWAQAAPRHSLPIRPSHDLRLHQRLRMTVDRWSGREVRALRDAKRMSLREFAAHLGVSDRMVSKWEAGGERIHPRPVNQATLDTSFPVRTFWSTLLSTARTDERAQRWWTACWSLHPRSAAKPPKAEGGWMYRSVELNAEGGR